MVRGEDGNLAPCTWEEALVEVASKMHSVKSEEMAAVAGAFADAESLVALKDLLHSFNSENLFTEEGFPNSGAGYEVLYEFPPFYPVFFFFVSSLCAIPVGIGGNCTQPITIKRRSPFPRISLEVIWSISPQLITLY